MEDLLPVCILYLINTFTELSKELDDEEVALDMNSISDAYEWKAAEPKSPAILRT